MSPGGSNPIRTSCPYKTDKPRDKPRAKPQRGDMSVEKITTIRTKPRRGDMFIKIKEHQCADDICTK
jgi:hypothetical protein